MSDQAKKAVRITMVAGEKSSDLLGAKLIRALRARIDNVEVSGICGPGMIREGASALFTIEEINSIGFEGLLGRIFKILRIRKQLTNEVLRTKPDLYIGIDAPDFNLTIEKKVRSVGIPTIQYVAPSVWAWRRYRLRKVKKAVSKLLTIYPFESPLYEKAKIPFTFVGHPLADEITTPSDTDVMQTQFGLNHSDRIIALLPGSRVNEVKRIAPVFIKAAARLRENNSSYKFAAALATDETHHLFVQIKQDIAPHLSIKISRGNAPEVIAASDVVLLASGTVALESAFFQKPVVVAYRLSGFSYALIKILSPVKLYSILNHLGESPVVPEFIQSECTSERIIPEILKILNDDIYRENMISQFRKFKTQLKRDASSRATDEVIKILHDRKP